MGLLFIGAQEMILIFFGLLLVVAVGYYGKDTSLGFWGSLLLSILLSPLIAFLVLFVLKKVRPVN